jgi:flavin reductase (DIM6/NTAB) family NADH-FMN oxidoreductase RutF
MSTDIDPALFRETLGHYPTGVAVVTALAEDGNPIGMVVGTFSSVSLDPPLIAFFPMSNSNSFAQLRTASTFCVNVLASDQEPLCRQLATGGATKFDGVDWHPGPLGSPILEDAVCWIECTFEDVREAGDHFIVLGRVHEFAVQRSTLPLLFFQGGYGRFSLGSFIAAPDPDLIQAAQLAEALRGDVEQLSNELGVTCSIVAKIHWDSVQVFAANQGGGDEPFPLGHRQPLIPPFGAVLMSDASAADVSDWLARAADRSEERRQLNASLLAKVRDRGYSLLAARPETLQHHQDVLSEFERSGGMPRHERVVRQVTSELAELFSPELVPGERYDLASIVVHLPTGPGVPPMALRMSGLPGSATTDQIESWIASLKRVAETATAITGSHR